MLIVAQIVSETKLADVDAIRPSVEFCQNQTFGRARRNDDYWVGSGRSLISSQIAIGGACNEAISACPTQSKSVILARLGSLIWSATGAAVAGGRVVALGLGRVELLDLAPHGWSSGVHAAGAPTTIL